ncbi:MAG: hypothetical protein NZ518_05970, partial [Dehalococcoidia bacterium]|nr:hypothetical protein [Dehalococcoidia bacterium]
VRLATAGSAPQSTNRRLANAPTTAGARTMASASNVTARAVAVTGVRTTNPTYVVAIEATVNGAEPARMRIGTDPELAFARWQPFSTVQLMELARGGRLYLQFQGFDGAVSQIVGVDVATLPSLPSPSQSQVFIPVAPVRR